MSDADPTAKRLSGHDDFAMADEPPGEFATGLVSLGFLTAALRRGARIWCLTAVVGLLLGIGIYLPRSSAYQATTTLLLVPSLNAQPQDAILTDIALAQSHTVAGRTVHVLGLGESASSFLSSYTVTALTDRVLLITINAPTSSAAVARATSLARTFLQFRAQQEEKQAQIILAALQQQVTQAQQQIKSVSKQIGQLSAQPTTTARQTKISQLRAQRSQEESQLPALEQTVSSNHTATRVGTAQIVRGSQVLDAAVPLHHSRFKRPALYALAGLFLGLMLGMGIVIIRALVSDRLRRRDDVAYALGAPVKLSVGKVRTRRGLLGRSGLAAAEDRDIRRIIEYLRSAVPRSSGFMAALTVVAVDDVQIAALALTSLAVAHAKKGKQVALVDLCSGAPAARLLGAKDPGVRTVSVNKAHLVVGVPALDSVPPNGPLRRTSQEGRRVSSREATAAYASADLLLTLATIDPSLGGEHLSTWTSDVVVMVTAGRSSATKIHAVGEMIRLAGMTRVSAVLVGADKKDESLGITHTPRSLTSADTGALGGMG